MKGIYLLNSENKVKSLRKLSDQKEKKFTLLLIAVITNIAFSTGQPVTITGTQLKKTASDGMANDLFGSAIAYYGNTIMIGAIGRDNYKGAVYVFRFNGEAWQESQILVDQNAVPGEFFGNSIDIDGNTAAIAGYGRSVVLIFKLENDAWVWKQTIADPRSLKQWFGNSLDLMGDRLIIGHLVDVFQTNGSAHIYRFNTVNSNWELIQSFYGSMRFGNSVAICDNNTFLVGDYFTSAGRVTVAKWNGTSWEETLLIPDDAVTNDSFGYSIATSGNRIFISATGYSTPTASVGAVYDYLKTESGFNLISKIIPDEYGPGMRFGSVLSANDNKFVVACDAQNYDYPVYLYDYKDVNHELSYKIKPDNPSANKQFGKSLSFWSDGFIAGAPGEENNKGAAYFFLPSNLGVAYGMEIRGVVLESGDLKVDSIPFNLPDDLPPGYYEATGYIRVLSPDIRLKIDDCLVSSDISNGLKKSYSNLVWLRRRDENSAWENIGGVLNGKYLQNRIPFTLPAQLIIADSVGTTSVKELESPNKSFEIHNYPNPFSETTRITLTLPADRFISLELFDILGKKAATLIKDYKPAGTYEIILNRRGLSDGIYFLHAASDGYFQVRKIIINSH